MTESVVEPVQACELCGEEAVGTVGHGWPYDLGPIMGLTGPGVAHRECMLRCVLGGIGHLEDHAYWCGKMGDPDGGRSYRQSALEVDAWVARNGIRSASDGIEPGE